MTKDDIIDFTGVLAKMVAAFTFGAVLGLTGVIAWSAREMTKRFH